MRQPCPCRHIRSGEVENDGTGLCEQCRSAPIPKTDVKQRRALGLATGPK